MASNSAALPPSFKPTTEFQHTAVHLNKSVTFKVSATGALPLTCQWQRDGEDLPGRTNMTLTIAAAQSSDEGDYTVEIANSAGKVRTPSARLLVVPPTPEFKYRVFTNAARERLPYYLFVPSNNDAGRRYPVVCIFHGLSSHESNLPGHFEDYPTMFAYASYRQQATDPAIVVWPTHTSARDDFIPRDRALVLELLDSLISNHSIDTNRIYIAGVSAGADDAWDLVGLRPDAFAGLFLWDGETGSTPPKVIRHVPVWAWGNTGTHTKMRRLRQAGGHPISTEYRNADHVGAIVTAQCTPMAMSWLLAQRRSQDPILPFAVQISDPVVPNLLETGASHLHLAGTTQTTEENITQVVWENLLATPTHGLAEGTTHWSISNLPLVPGKTNVVIVTATLDANWAPAFGGTTIVSDTLSVVSNPVRLDLKLSAGQVILDWTGGVPPFSVQSAPAIDAVAWAEWLKDALPPIVVPADGSRLFLRVVGR
jgi:dienelactone hydrolase